MSNVSAAHHVMLDDDKIKRDYPHVYATTAETKMTLRPERFHVRYPTRDFWRVPYGEIAYWYFKSEDDLNLFKEWVKCQSFS